MLVPLLIGGAKVRVLSLARECTPSCANGGMCFPRGYGAECFCPQPYGGPSCETLEEATVEDTNEAPLRVVTRADSATAGQSILKVHAESSRAQPISPHSTPLLVAPPLRTHNSTAPAIVASQQRQSALDLRSHDHVLAANKAVFSMALKMENPLITDAASAKFFFWSAMCNDVAPCPAKIFLDDVTVTTFDPSNIVFEVAPSNSDVKIDDITQQITTQLNTPGSALFKYFSTMDGPNSAVTESSATVTTTRDPEKKTTTATKRKVTLDEKHTPMSTTMTCIMILTFQFFLIYTTVFVLGMLQSLNWGTPRRADDSPSARLISHDVAPEKPKFAFIAVLERCKSTVFFAPMLSILFLCARMRALQITQNQGAPPLVTQDMMFAVSGAVAGQMVIILIQSSFDASGPFRLLGLFLDLLEKGFMILMYIGTVAIMLSVVTMTPESCMAKRQQDKVDSLWPDGPPVVSPAVGATINLTVQFFVIYLGVKIMESIETFSKKDDDGLPEKAWIITWKNTFDLAKATVNFAPMLSILFVGARMRALEIDPKTGAPQPWAQTCFYVCAYGVAVQAVLVLLGPLCGISAKKGEADGDIIYTSSSKSAEIALVVTRYVCLATMYGGFSAVILSVYTIVDKTGAVPAMAAATASVIELSVLYFSIYLIFLLTQTVGQVAKRPFTHARSTFKATLTSVEFCPMLAVLCLATRMRAKEVNPAGSPQGWAQDAMRLTVMAIALQVCAGFGFGLFTAVNHAVCSILAFVTGLVRSVALILLYVALVIICCSVIVISPQSANGQGSLLPDFNPNNNYWETPPPLSTTVKCVVILVVQFFAINAANFMGRKVCDALAIDHGVSPTLRILERSKSTVFFAPMLSILFVGARMRALQLTQGQGAPQLWAQDMMQLATFAVLGQLLLVLLQGAFQVDKSKGDSGRYVAMVVDMIEKAVMIAMYGGMLGVVSAILSMSPEACLKEPNMAKAMWPGGSPPVSPAVDATINLAVQFFVIYLGVKIMETITTFAAKDDDGIPQAEWIVTWKTTFDMAKVTVNFAPMLCILFIGTRMRALEIDPKKGAPQPWAQTCFYLCTYGVLAQAVIVLLGPPCGIKAIKGDVEGDVKFQSASKTVTVALSLVRWATLLATYGGFSAIMYSVVVITDKHGNTPSVSPALQNVILMTIQYFSVYLGVLITFSIQQICSISLPRVMNLFLAFVLTVDLCPMLSVMYLATRMRAMDITDGSGGPPGWVQDAMFVATFSVLVQLILTIGGSRFALIVALQALTWFLTLGASLLVCLGIVTMTPRTSTGEGSVIAPHVAG